MSVIEGPKNRLATNTSRRTAAADAALDRLARR